MPTIQPRANKAVVTDVYEDTKQLVECLARRFSVRYKTDPDETLARANMHFLEAYHTFVPGVDRNGKPRKLYKRVWAVIWYRLMDWLESEVARGQRCCTATDLNWELDDGSARNRDANHDRSHIDGDNAVQKKFDLSRCHTTGTRAIIRMGTRQEFDQEEFESRLGSEASVNVLDIALQTHLWHEPGVPEQTALRRYLSGLGWAAGQITEALSEIKRALL